MKTALMFVFGWVSSFGLAGCGSAGQGGAADEGVVGEETSALTWNDRVANGTRHDFNGDGREDIIAVSSSGSELLRGVAGGGYYTGTWLSSDLKYNSVDYAVGDFNGDHYSDAIITTASGSYEYFGQANGSLVAGAWVRNDLTLGNVKYTVGDFNHDGISDLIVTTTGGSWQYLGKLAGGFNSYYFSATGLPNVDFTPGDFNGDGSTDVIFTTAAGSYLYTGYAGGFNVSSWNGSAYPLHSVEFHVGNFNGTNLDGRLCDDLIARTTTDARELLGNASTTGSAIGFNAPTWQHPEYSLSSNVQLVPGDYNGDGKTDLVISTGSGTTLVLGQYGGGFASTTWSRSDVDSYHVGFVRGDYSGEGRDDLIVMLGHFKAGNTPGSDEYLGQASGATPAGFTNSVWHSSAYVLGDAVLFY